LKFTRFFLVIGFSLVIAGCFKRPLLYDVEVYPSLITPNADGDDDAANIFYKLSRNAVVSIYFVDEEGERHYFRKERPRSASKETYHAVFGGAIEIPSKEARLPSEARVLPDGKYTWVIEARDEGGHTEKVEGELFIEEADRTLPMLEGFSVFPKVFTPNRDGIDDRVRINYDLAKRAEVKLYLLDEEGRKYPIAEEEGPLSRIKPGEPGPHTYDYDGGVDLGAPPPPDGVYLVVAVAEDIVGNRVVVTDTLTIKNGGVPMATILNLEVDFWPTIVPLGETLHFTATIENYGPVPIRTTGPEPGTQYRSDENFNNLGWHQEPGAWRFGIDFEGNPSYPYPFRWALGREEELTKVFIHGNEYNYLMPGQRVQITGSIKILTKPPRNPAYFYAGLIHEDVWVVNDKVDPEYITVDVPAEGPWNQ